MQELDDITWLQMNSQNRIVERTLRICGTTIYELLKKHKQKMMA